MAWRASGKRGLPIIQQSSWPSNAKSRILNQFKKPDGGYRAGAAGAFLVADSSKSDTQEGYKLPFAVVVDGKIKGASSAGLAAAARRLPQVKGVPSGVLSSARGIIDGYQKKMGKESEELMPAFEELQVDIGTFQRQLRRAFSLRFRMRPSVIDSAEAPGWLFVEDVFVDHPTLNNSLVVDKTGELWRVSFNPDAEGFDFAPTTEWEKVVRTYVPASGSSTAPASEVAEVDDEGEMAEFAEAELGTAVTLIEGDGDGPLQMEIAVIEPGWGNKTHNNYYPAAVLERDANVFEGAKMYATDHRQSEKNVLTEVSQILECPVRFTESGAPVARVGIFNTQFAESIRSRDQLGVLGDLHCSILAGGKVKPGFESGGRKGREVVAITEVASVDWVTRHGAGGRALSLAESDEMFMEADMNEHDDVLDTEAEEATGAEEADVQETALVEDATATATEEEVASDTSEEPESDDAPASEPAATPPEPVEATESAAPAAAQFMEAADVNAIIAEVKNLPEATVARLKEGHYHNRYDVITAIQAEQDYLAMITESGKPPKFGEGSGETPAELTEVDVRKRQDEVNSKFLPGVPAAR